MRLLLVVYKGEHLPQLQQVTRELEQQFQVKKIVEQIPKQTRVHHDQHTDQFVAEDLIRPLAEHDADYVVGITAHDLYVPGYGSLFGYGSRSLGVAVISTYAFEGRADRLLKQVMHELGHLQGLEHCSNDQCVMFEATSLKERDLASPYLCDRCEEEL